MKILLSFCILFFSAYNTIATAAPKADQAKNFSFLDLEGKKHHFNEYRGKWVLVNYWATYCPPCRAEIPDIERFAQDNKNEIVVLGMDAGGVDKAGILAFKEEMGISYSLIPAQESTMLAFGLIMGIPTSYLVSPEGEIVNKTVGIITYDDLDYYLHPPIFTNTSSN